MSNIPVAPTPDAADTVQPVAYPEGASSSYPPPSGSPQMPAQSAPFYESVGYAPQNNGYQQSQQSSSQPVQPQVQSAQPVQPPVQPFQPFQPPAQPVQPHYAAPLMSRDHVAAGLLAIFLGCFGVHKFYLGYSTQGFVMLALSLIGGLFSFGLVMGIVWIIAIIEGATYLAKTQSEFERIYIYGKREWF
ncbi:MAG: NINE protein [Eggerthellaceae bacterium]